MKNQSIEKISMEINFHSLLTSWWRFLRREREGDEDAKREVERGA